MNINYDYLPLFITAFLCVYLYYIVKTALHNISDSHQRFHRYGSVFFHFSKDVGT